MSHTPGPWSWTYDGSSDYSIGPDDPQVRSVATVHHRDPDIGDANACLVASAPELLAALEYIYEHCGDPIMENVCRAAIAKAEGTS